MTTKLTLALDESVVKMAKRYADKRKISLSKLIEFYFLSLTGKEARGSERLSPVTASLCGAVRSSSTKKYKKLLTEALEEKYL